MFILCLCLSICQVGCKGFERRIFCSKLTELLLRFMPVTWCTGCIIGKSLTPGRLECPGRGIHVQALDQSSGAITGLQETGVALPRRAEADDTHYRALVVQRWSTTVTMLHVTTYL